MTSGPGVFGPNPYVDKTPVVGRIVAVLRGVSDRRGLELAGYRSRAAQRGQVHELMITDEPAELDSTVNRVALIAFVEITDGGVLLVGDRVTIADRSIGIIAGFDETHMPNHQNICLRGELRDGQDFQARLGDIVHALRA